MTCLQPLASAAGLLAALWSASAAAATCNVSPQSVNFGNYDTLASATVDGVGNVSVTCDAETTFTIALGTGTGTYSARQMTSGANVLEYNLHTDASRLTVWGDGSAGTATVARTAATAEVTVYGRLPARQNVPAGQYSDTLVVTVSY